MIDQISHPQAQPLPAHWLFRISGVTGLIVACILIAGAVELVFSAFRPVFISGWLTLLQNNWLIILFKLHAGFHGVHASRLYQINLPDLLILALTAILYVGLYAALRHTSRIWSLIALVQPILGIALFLFTKSAGRSALMGAELVASLVMLRSKFFGKRIAYTGTLSALLLLAGDMAASLAPSTILAVGTGAGYALLVVWLFLVSRRLVQIGQDNEME